MDISTDPKLRALFDYTINHTPWTHYDEGSPQFIEYHEEYARLAEEQEGEIVYEH